MIFWSINNEVMQWGILEIYASTLNSRFTPMLKKSAFIALSISAVMASPAFAQEYPGCFMVDGSGNLINLPTLCPSSPSSTVQASASPQSLTREQFEQIKEGMTREEVEKIMGFPGIQPIESTTQNSGGETTTFETYSWEAEGKRISIVFVNGQASRISFYE